MKKEEYTWYQNQAPSNAQEGTNFDMMAEQGTRKDYTEGAGVSPLDPSREVFPDGDFSFELPFFSTDFSSLDFKEKENDISSIDSLTNVVMQLDDVDKAVDFVLDEGLERGACEYPRVDSRRMASALNAFAVLAERARMMNKRKANDEESQANPKSAAAKRRRRVGGRFEKEIGFVCVPR